MSGPQERTGFVDALRRRVRLLDVALLAVVPVVMLAVYVLPYPLKRSLAFSYVDPSPITAVTAHYVHLSPGHLVANLAGYAVIASVGYLLAVLADRRRLFGLSMVVYLVVFPPVLSALNLAVPRPAITYGFSGVNMAIAGLLPLLLAGYLGRRLMGTVSGRDAPALFFLVMALIALVAIPRRPSTLIVAAGSGLVALVYTGRLVVDAAAGSGNIVGFDRESGPIAGWVELGAAGVVVAIGYPLVGFPTDVTGPGLVVNLYVHTLGYSIAFIVPYIAFELGLLTEPGEKGFSR